MPTRSLIAFTGGLDSTYVLHEELKKGRDVEVLYAYVLQGESARLAELSERRRILNHFRNRFPGQIKNEWITPNAGLNIMQMANPRRPQLVQQYNTMNALIQVLLQSDADITYRPMTGWHHMDVLENDPGEGQTEETYQLYKQIFTSLVRSVDVERTKLCGLLTPAWDVSKKEMWDSLDDWTRINIVTAHRFDQVESRNGGVVLIGAGADKTKEYHAMGLDVSATTATHYSLLSPLDRYFLGAHAYEGDGMCSIFGKCKDYYTALQPIVISALNPERLAFIEKARGWRTEIVEIITGGSK